ncbi:MAG: bifunctional phosphoribosylaminoimidazolecarboxamide formyltransferase/IMP cyclohydrolase [Chloroflexota bacterium]|nr:bifunctional phosphoribosylaminoimidazolecarboxamide formyltransferase/IMP cyclohydrolase [Chloroflexota bacterium]
MRALLSVYDKSGIVALARGLLDAGYEIVSTGGTLAALTGAGIPAVAVSEVTGAPEILDGRVKTLHPAIHGGLLARRANAGHAAELATHGILPIDLLAVNLYPFGETVARPHVPLEEALEQIDIGGPAMIRAAAKNFPDVVVLTDPADYEPALRDLVAGTMDAARRRALAARAFAHVAAYDAVVADYLLGVDGRVPFPSEISIAGRKERDLRYGENPHQGAAAYRRLTAGAAPLGMLDALQRGGKELSFNNLLDADAAWAALSGCSNPAAAIVKHTLPCGLATRDRLEDAFAAALAGDPVSAFGGIVAVNRPLDGQTAGRIVETFFEVVIAPAFEPAAFEVLAAKRQLRLLELPGDPNRSAAMPPWDVRPIAGGLLVQEADVAADDSETWRVVSRREPSQAEWTDLRFAWSAVRRVASNAIVLAAGEALVGVGGGQPSRLDSVRIATLKAGSRAAGAALASDAFFPFRDGVEAAAAAGVAAIVQPGGSVRDGEVIAAADEAGMAMVLTGVRHFRH